MNKKIIVLGILIFLTGMFVSYSFSHMMNESNISKIIDNMTLEEKISQMLIVYYPSSKIDSYLENKLSSSPFGGFILANKNITDYESTRKFVSDLKSKSKYPLIISIDEEGGEVQRLKNLTDVEVSDIPSMRDIGNTNDERLSHDIGTLMAEELRTIGVNVVYGPVLDISDDSSFIGKRSFSNNSEVVSKMSLSFSKGLEQNKVIPVYKHFPGYGSTTIDSHLNLPVINKSLDELMNNDLIPFKNAINNDAKLIMVSHMVLPQITHDNTPASLSKEIITNILKNKLNYKGLVISDALDMKALTNNYSYESIIVNSINAGVDLLLMPTDYEETINIIKTNISEERINESVKKILKFKYKYLNKEENLDKIYLNSDKHKEILNR